MDNHLKRNRPTIHLDFETRSTLDLKKCGLWPYAEARTTEVLCMAYAIEQGPVHLWHMAHPAVDIDESPAPLELFEAIHDRMYVEAHNASFERVIWMKKCLDKGWPAIDDSLWRCSAAKAAAHNIPRSLEMASRAMGLPLIKDKEGHKIMLKLCKPRKATETDQSPWHEKPEELLKLWRYCITDVAVERLLSEYLLDLSPYETDVFLADQLINSRGIACDVGLVRKALSVVREMMIGFNAELSILTDGEVTQATKRAMIMNWLCDQGLEIPDTQGVTLEAYIKKPGLDPKLVRVLEICRDANKTSTAKYQAMNLRVSKDNRIRGTLLYHGAGTGRWAGSGIQPHNFPRGAIQDMVTACQDILDGDATWLDMLYGNVMEFLSWTLRGALVAGPGKDLLVSDYAAIEARVVMWYGDEQEGLTAFREGKDIYKYMAQDIYHVAYELINKVQRQMGKQAILGLGFQMGDKKFLATCAKYGIIITPEFSTMVVEAYRAKYQGIVKFWDAVNQAAMNATLYQGRRFRVGRVQYARTKRFLFCRLPSGRMLAYYNPKIQPVETPWGEKRDAVTFMGVNPYTRQWERQSTYGGKLTENIVQATARDLMAAAILRAEATGQYPIVLSVHDELIAEVDEGTGDIHEFEALMCEDPGWADGLPVAAEGWRGKRYKK